tara:strand:+ start:498 stop:815 length:318 start_codon:yes stop_codon:yes gene_type:complete
MLDFKFDKAFYKEAELLKKCPVPRSTFHKWQNEWISKGKDPKLMGKILVKGTSTVFWNGPMYLNWLIKNKLIYEPKYDYEESDREKAFLVVEQLTKKKKVKTNEK